MPQIDQSISSYYGDQNLITRYLIQVICMTQKKLYQLAFHI